jgi:O-antigen ligase
VTTTLGERLRGGKVSEPPARPPAPSRTRQGQRNTRRNVGIGALYAAFGLLLVVATWASTTTHGVVLAAVFAVLVLGLAGLVMLGLDGLGMLVLCLCFFMAPYFRAFPLVSGSAVSAIDPLLMMACVLLIPRIRRGKFKASALYLCSVSALILIGTTASLASSSHFATAFEVIQWTFLALVLPLVFMALNLSKQEINRFALLYIGGQMLSTLDAFAKGPDPTNGRYQGLAGHPNYFADGAMMSAALLLYLYHDPRAKGWLMRSGWWLLMGINVFAINVSGCRGAAVGLAAVIVLVPLVEKSPISSVLAMGAAALGLVLVQPIIQSAGEGSTIARLTGQDGSGDLTTNFRLSEWSDALAKIQHSPFIGNGLSIDILSFHNNYLEVAAGIGIFGLVAYLLMLWSLTRGLFGPSLERRLLYPMVAFAVYGFTQPGFKDRSNWLPMLLGIALFQGYRVVQRSIELPEEPAELVLPAEAEPVLTGAVPTDQRVRRDPQPALVTAGADPLLSLPPLATPALRSSAE